MQTETSRGPLTGPEGDGPVPAGGPRWRALLEMRWRARLQEVTELALAYHEAAAAADRGGGESRLEALRLLRPGGIVAVEDLAAGPDATQFTVTKLFGRATPGGALGWTGNMPTRAARALRDAGYDVRDIGATLASGSFRTAGMVIAPCSIKTAGAIAACYSDTLVSRAADVTLKEGRPLILVVRETPLHLGHLRVLTTLAEMGAVILPPMPAFYNRPKDLDDVVNHTVARVLDRLQLPQTLVGEWQGGHRRGPGAAGG